MGWQPSKREEFASREDAPSGTLDEPKSDLYGHILYGVALGRA